MRHFFVGLHQGAFHPGIGRFLGRCIQEGRCRLGVFLVFHKTLVDADQMLDRGARNEHVHDRSFRPDGDVEYADRADLHTVQPGYECIAKVVIGQFTLRSVRELIASQLIKLPLAHAARFLRAVGENLGCGDGRRSDCER